MAARGPASRIRAMAGIFVGGASRRMGGSPKGLLPTPDGVPLVEHAMRVLLAAGIETVVLVGAHPGYAAVDLERLCDRPAGIGPLGGLVALLERCGDRPVVALACDMPFVSTALVRKLLEAPDAAIVACRRNERWEPLCARYDPVRVLPVALRGAAEGTHSLQGLLDRLPATPLVLSDDQSRELDDWDTPEDVATRR